MILKKNSYLVKVGQSLRSTFEKFKTKNKKQIKMIYIICSDEYQPWEIKVLQKLRECLESKANWKDSLKDLF